TAILAVTALAAATLLGLPLGIVSGSRAGRAASAIASVSAVLLSLPSLLTSLLLLVVAARTGWFPVGNMRSAATAPTFASGAADLLWHLALPATALALPIAATFERLQSQAMADVVRQPYVIAAQARGVPRSRLLWRCQLRAAPP